MKYLPGLLLLFVIPEVQAQSIGIPAISVDGGNGDGQTYTVTLEILALMTMLTLLPAILLMMTSFTRIIIVLSILRQALGTAQTPSNQIILGLSLFLTLFIMSPVLDQAYQVAIEPYLNGSMSAIDAMRAATEPFKTFMLAQTRETDIRMFADIAGVTEIESPEKTPLTLLMPAFVTSELKTAFQIGFLIFIPFVIIDLVVASVLMSMGMMMLSPMIISLPFKLMLFVLVDGWALIMGTLASSFMLAS
jgi:flagellar biosynthetic protein FliP